MINRYLAVISVDALVTEDLPDLLALENSAALFRHCACVEKMETVYPSLTHPVHASLISGCACGKTGVVHNERFEPFADEPTWYNQLSDIRCETVFHTAHRHGLTSCAARWPVTAWGNDIIDYIVPEVLDSDLAGGVDMETALIRGGAEPVLEDIVRPNLFLLNGNSRPGYDAFSAACAADIVRRYKPNLLFTHWGMVDSARHRHGVFGPHIQDALKWIDKWVGWLADAYRDAGISEQTDFILLSDHGQLNVRRKVRLNALFLKHGLIKVDATKRIISWDVFAVGGGLSAHVYLRDRNNEALYYRVRDLLTKLLPDECGGFFQILTADEARKNYGLYDGFSFVLETDGRTLFEDELREPWVWDLTPEDAHAIRAAHGHMPHKGSQPPFLAAGPSFLPGKSLENGSILDVAPSIATVMGFELPEAEGKPMREIMRI